MTPEEQAAKDLQKYGIRLVSIDRTNDTITGYHFNCDKHPYQEETIPGLKRQELFNKLGNIFDYNAGTKKLTIKKTTFPSASL